MVEGRRNTSRGVHESWDALIPEKRARTGKKKINFGIVVSFTG